MGPRRWIALASIALAVIVLFFALQLNFSDTENAPGREANKETIKQIPSNPDTVAPR